MIANNSDKRRELGYNSMRHRNNIETAIAWCLLVLGFGTTNDARANQSDFDLNAVEIGYTSSQDSLGSLGLYLYDLPSGSAAVGINTSEGSGVPGAGGWAGISFSLETTLIGGTQFTADPAETEVREFGAYTRINFYRGFQVSNLSAAEVARDSLGSSDLSISFDGIEFDLFASGPDRRFPQFTVNGDPDVVLEYMLTFNRTNSNQNTVVELNRLEASNGQLAVISSQEVSENGSVVGPNDIFSIGSRIQFRGPQQSSIRHFVTWGSSGSAGNDNSGTSVQARIVDGFGNLVSDQFQVNNVTALGQRNPAVAAGPDGPVVIVWESESSGGDDDSLTSVQARVFDMDGNPAGDQIQVNQTAQGFQYQPDVAVRDDGSFLVVWTELGFTENRLLIRGFGPDGLPLSDETELNEEPLLTDEPGPKIVAGGRNLAVAWVEGQSIMLREALLPLLLFADGFEDGEPN